MHRRQVLARAGVGLSALTAGCGSLGIGREAESVTVNPAVDGTPTPESEQTPPNVGDWHVDLDTTESRVGVYGDRLVVAEQFEGQTRVRGFDTKSGEQVYEREFGTRYNLTRIDRIEERYGTDVVTLDGPQVRLLDAATGETVWKLTTPADVLFVQPGTRYVFAGEDEWTRLLTLDAETWTRESLVDISTGLFDYGDGYVLREATEEERTDGTETPPVGTDVACHDVQTAETLWTTTLPVPLANSTSERAGDNLFFTREKVVACHDFETGARRYTVETDVPLGGMWAKDEERVYFGNLNGGETGRVFAFGDDGEVWQRDFGGEAAYPIRIGDQFHVLVSGPDRSRVVRVDPATGDVRWRHRGHFHGPASGGGVYVRRSSRVARIDDDGSVVWQSDVGVTPGPRARYWREQGGVFLAWDGGELVALDAATGRERRRVDGFDSLYRVVRRAGDGGSSERVFLNFLGRIAALSV